jgi:putative membrane protein
MAMHAAVKQDSKARLWSSRILLGSLVVFTILALAGYASFGRHPELVASVPGAVGAYGYALQLFPIAQVWLAFGVICLYLTLYTGFRWVPALAFLYAISLASELLGTGYGLPFGPYHYSTLLGAEWLGRVPVLIPLSWFSMAVCSYGLALRLGPSRGSSRPALRIGLASLLLLCWDLSLDPAMSNATTFWVWGSHGPYYGMPWSNLAGWYLTGVVLAAALVLLRSDSWIQKLSAQWLAWFYGANVLLAAGMSLAAGLWLAVIVTLLALAIVLLCMPGTRAMLWSGDGSHSQRAWTSAQ